MSYAMQVGQLDLRMAPVAAQFIAAGQVEAVDLLERCRAQFDTELNGDESVPVLDQLQILQREAKAGYA